MKKVRFNSTMKESTKNKLHEIAQAEGRSDSNMVEHLIDMYEVGTKVEKKSGEPDKCNR